MAGSKSNGSMANILIGNRDFRQFLKAVIENNLCIPVNCSTRESAKKVIYWLFEIESCRELNKNDDGSNTDNSRQWSGLVGDFYAFRKYG